jgi:hypothetical protein
MANILGVNFVTNDLRLCITLASDVRAEDDGPDARGEAVGAVRQLEGVGEQLFEKCL